MVEVKGTIDLTEHPIPLTLDAMGNAIIGDGYGVNPR